MNLINLAHDYISRLANLTFGQIPRHFDECGLRNKLLIRLSEEKLRRQREESGVVFGLDGGDSFTAPSVTVITTDL